MITVLHHADADGFGAAYAIWKAHRHYRWTDSINFIPVQYGQPIPEIPENTGKLFIVDFSYDRETCQELSTKYKLFIIDHHKTAEKELEDLDFCKFDMTKSGAVLTWEWFFNGDKPIPDLLKYVQDRDLWKFELPDSKAVSAYILSMPWDFHVWDKFNLEKATAAGTAILVFQDAQIQLTLKDAEEHLFGPSNADFAQMQMVPMVNCGINISEVGAALLKEYPDSPYCVMYQDRVGGKRSYSLRSRDNFDVANLCRTYGGGGHTNAAGFTINWRSNAWEIA